MLKPSIHSGRFVNITLISPCHACKKRVVKPQFLFKRPVRTTPDYPLTYTGAICFGPVYDKIGRRVEKRRRVIYPCLATRAVHLDKLYSMTQDSFINSYRRFVSPWVGGSWERLIASCKSSLKSQLVSAHELFVDSLVLHVKDERISQGLCKEIAEITLKGLLT